MNIKNLLTLSLSLILMGDVNAQEAADSMPASEDAVVEPISPIEEAPTASTQEVEDTSMPASEDAAVASISPIEEAPTASAQEAEDDSMPTSEERPPVTEDVLDQINKFIEEVKEYHSKIIIEYSDGGLEIGCEGKINDILQSLSTQFWCKNLKSFKIKCSSFHTRNLENVLSKMTNLQELHLANTDLGTKAEKDLKNLGETLSSLSRLQTLSLTGNDKLSFKIRALLPDSTKVSNLQKLFLANNALNNIKNDDILKSLKEKLSSFSKLEVLDLGGNELRGRLIELLPDNTKTPYLKKLCLENNKLGRIETDDKLKDLKDKLSSFSRLELLNLSENKLEDKLIELLPDSTKTPHLKKLYLKRNAIAKLNETKLNTLNEKLSSFSNLEVLDLGGNELGGKLIELLPDSTKTPHLKKLYLRYNKLGILDNDKLNTLNSRLLSFPKLERLDLADNKLNKGLTNLLPKLLAARNLQTISLDLSSERIGYWSPEALETLNKILSSCSHLKELNLPSNDLGSLNNEVLNNLADTLSSFSELEVLDLSGNDLGKKLITLRPAIEKMKNLKILALVRNDLEEIDTNKLNDLNEFLLALPKLELLKINGGNGLTELLPSLIEARGSQTRYLNLRGKCIGTLAPKELQTVNNALLSCSHLEELDLFGNALGNRLTTLLPAIQGMNKLKKLDLGGLDLHKMNKDDLKALQAGLASLSNLEKLSLSWNSLETNLIELLPAIQKIKNLKKLNLQCVNLYKMNKDDLNALMKELSSLPNLEELDLSGNNLGNRLITLFSPIKETDLQNLNLANLQSLNLSWNNLHKMSLDEWQAFLAEISGMSKLQVLELMDSFDNSALNAFIEALSQTESFAGIPNLMHYSSTPIAEDATRSLELRLSDSRISDNERAELQDALSAFNSAINVTFE